MVIAEEAGEESEIESRAGDWKNKFKADLDEEDLMELDL